MRATVVLVHGAFHGGWCWSRVVEGLTDRGVAALAPDLPGRGGSAGSPGGLPADAARVRSWLEDCDGPVVLCGHSYGGLVIGEAADEGCGVSHLVYLAAPVADLGESLVDCVGDPELAPIASAFRPAPGGLVQMDPARAEQILYPDCRSELARDAAGRLGPQHPGSFEDPATRAPWRSTDSTYVVCREDRALDARAQERWARRCRRTVRWPTGHCPMLSRPELLVDLLTELAEGAEGLR